MIARSDPIGLHGLYAQLLSFELRQEINNSPMHIEPWPTVLLDKTTMLRIAMLVAAGQALTSEDTTVDVVSQAEAMYKEGVVQPVKSVANKDTTPFVATTNLITHIRLKILAPLLQLPTQWMQIGM